jgi:hypothetical protein
MPAAPPPACCQDQAFLVAAAHEIDHGAGALGLDAERLQRLAAEQQRRLEGFAHAEVDVPSESLTSAHV